MFRACDVCSLCERSWLVSREPSLMDSFAIRPPFSTQITVVLVVSVPRTRLRLVYDFTKHFMLLLCYNVSFSAPPTGSNHKSLLMPRKPYYDCCRFNLTRLELLAAITDNKVKVTILYDTRYILDTLCLVCINARPGSNDVLCK